MPKIVVYPGTYDPIHYGHIALIKKIAPDCDRVIVAVAKKTGEKHPSLSFEERVRLVSEVINDLGLEKVEVCGFEGLLVRFAEKYNATAILRGIRNEQDSQDEAIISRVTRSRIGTLSFFNPFKPPLETLFLTLQDSEFNDLSSTKVRELIRTKQPIERFVPPRVIELYRTKTLPQETKVGSGAIDWKYRTTYTLLTFWDEHQQTIGAVGFTLLSGVAALAFLISCLDTSEFCEELGCGVPKIS